MDRKLPNGWKKGTLSSVGQLLRGVSYRKEDASEQPKTGYVPILRATNIQNERLILDNELVYVPSNYVKPEQYLEPNDIVVCMSSGSKHLVGKTAQLFREWRGSFGTFCATIRPDNAVNAKFVGYYFSSPDYRDFIRKKSSGININNLKPADFENLEIPIPPLPEQERIVRRIESLFTRLEAGVAGLKRAQVALKRYRASVLKAACEGRLVPQDPNDEPAEMLLHQLGKLPLMGVGYRLLPEGWCWIKVEQLASSEPGAIQSGPFGSDLHHSEFQETGILVIGIDNVLDGRFSSGKQHRISPIKYSQLRKFTARPLDVLITVMATVGRCCVVPSELEPAIITKHVYRISVEKTLVDPHFLMYSLLGSEVVRNQLFGEVRGQTRPGINGTILKNIDIPLPPLAEQRRIVAEVERRLSVVQEVEATVQANLRRAARLRQAILKRAFEGRLVE